MSFIDWYNHRRRHIRLDNKSPGRYEQNHQPAAHAALPPGDVAHRVSSTRTPRVDLEKGDAPESSFDSESKWDGNDEFYLQEYVEATDSFVVVADAILVDR